MKTSKEQLEHVKDWERRNPERAQARKNKWFATAKGLAWIKKNQKRRNAKRKLWRAKKRRQAANSVITNQVAKATNANDLDLSKIAVKHGGGGHKGACGFAAKSLPWVPTAEAP